MPPRSHSQPRPLSRIQTANALSLSDFRSTYFPSPLSLTLTLPTSPPRPDPSLQKSISSQISPPLNTSVTTTLTLTLHSPLSLPRSILRQCLDLIALTSSSAYRASSIGWSRAEKRREMQTREMRYLILKAATPLHRHHHEGEGECGKEEKVEEKVDEEGEEEASEDAIQGFSSFMLTTEAEAEDECEAEVLYIYEIHLVPPLRGLGVGKTLMEVMEGVGRRCGVQKSMLTVFESNGAAIKFYEGLGYKVDGCSPKPQSQSQSGEVSGEREVEVGRRLRSGKVRDVGREVRRGYVILSKGLREGEEEGEGKGKGGREKGREGAEEGEGGIILSPPKKKRKK